MKPQLCQPVLNTLASFIFIEIWSILVQIPSNLTSFGPLSLVAAATSEKPMGLDQFLAGKHTFMICVKFPRVKPGISSMPSVKNAWADKSIRRLLICSDFGRGQVTNNLHQYHLIYCIHTNSILSMMLRRKAQQWPTALQDSCFPAHEKMRGASQWVLACINFYLTKRQVLLSLSTVIYVYICTL